MKTLMYLLAIFLFMTSSCKKPGEKKTTIPEQMSFEIIGTDGKSMVQSAKDTIVINYYDNNISHSFNLSIVKLPISVTDTLASSKYNGLFITDNFRMSDLSSRDPNPIRTFYLSLNGLSLGIIYLDYWQYQASYPSLSSPALTFNNIPVTADTTAHPISTISAGSDLNLLQVQ